MPAWEKDVEEAIDEGIVINPDLSPSKITHEKGRVTGIEFTRCISVFDDEGGFNPTCDLDDTRFVDADNVLISIGQAADMSFLAPTANWSANSGARWWWTPTRWPPMCRAFLPAEILPPARLL